MTNEKKTAPKLTADTTCAICGDAGGHTTEQHRQTLPKLTAAQRRMLECVKAWNGESWGEIDMQFLSRSRLPRFLEMASAKAVADALIRKGLVVDGDGAVSITPAGRAALKASKET